MATQTRTGNLSTGARFRARAITVVVTVLATLAVWGIAALAFGRDDLVVQQGDNEPMELGAAAFIFFSALPALLGWAFLEALERFAGARARIVWTGVAVAVLALSYLPLLSVEAAGGTKATLGVLHLVVATVLIVGFWRTGASRPE